MTRNQWISVRHEFEPNQRLPLFPWAKIFTPIHRSVLLGSRKNLYPESFLSTGWFQEWIQALFYYYYCKQNCFKHNRNIINCYKPNVHELSVLQHIFTCSLYIQLIHNDTFTILTLPWHLYKQYKLTGEWERGSICFII